MYIPVKLSNIYNCSSNVWTLSLSNFLKKQDSSLKRLRLNRNSTEAQAWCENTLCPAPKDAGVDNCCVHHFNLHSCPLSGTNHRLCGPWISPQGDTFTHSSAAVGPINQGNWTSRIQGLGVADQTDIIAHYKIAGMSLALVAHVKVLPRTGTFLCTNIFRYKWINNKNWI